MAARYAMTSLLVGLTAGISVALRRQRGGRGSWQLEREARERGKYYSCIPHGTRGGRGTCTCGDRLQHSPVERCGGEHGLGPSQLVERASRSSRDSTITRGLRAGASASPPKWRAQSNAHAQNAPKEHVRRKRRARAIE